MPNLSRAVVARGGRARTALLLGVISTSVFGIIAVLLAASAENRRLLAGAGALGLALPGLIAIKLCLELISAEAKSARHIDAVSGAQRQAEVRAQERGDEALQLAAAVESLRDDVSEIQVVSREDARRLTRLAESREAIDGRVTLALEKARVNAWHLQRERDERIADAARGRSTRTYPPRLVVQLTLPRAGSTRLYDIIRCWPGAYVEPLSYIWDELGLSGRRYPIGMSNLAGATTPILAAKGVGAVLRSMSDQAEDGVDPAFGHVAVEKAHPMFFQYDVDAFVAAIDRFEYTRGTTVDLVYQVRRPLDVMWSMAEYKARTPSWHGGLEIGEIPEYVLRSVRTLQLLLGRRNGLVVDYAEVSRSRPELDGVVSLLTSASGGPADDGWLDRASERTDHRRVTDTDFVGAHSDRTLDGPDGAWGAHGSMISQATEIYDELLAGRTPSTGHP